MFFFSSRRRHTRYWRDWSSDVCSSDLIAHEHGLLRAILLDQGADGGAFVRPDGRTRLDDAAAHRDPESQAFPFALHELYTVLADLPRHVAVVHGGRYALLLDEGASWAEFLPRKLLQLLDPLQVR